MAVLITGADGFIARNLAVRLEERKVDVVAVTRRTPRHVLERLVSDVDFVFHLGGANRPTNESEFHADNTVFTADLCAAMRAAGNSAPIVFSSSTQAIADNAYGRSKREAEEVLFAHHAKTGSPVHVFRLPNVFGKWSRPYYNSVVATFCDQIARGMTPSVHDPDAALNLVYIDDVVGAFLDLVAGRGSPGGFCQVSPVYSTTVGEVAAILQRFHDSRASLITERVGSGLARALHATYLSALRPIEFAYDVQRHVDSRGEFVEMLKTLDSGQFSYFTAHPGVTRGEHYHHSKTEKFLVIRGEARFGFRHIATGEFWSLEARGGEGRIVETAPGWAHDITNVGSGELIVMLWANEIFDRSKPDTYARKVME